MYELPNGSTPLSAGWSWIVYNFTLAFQQTVHVYRATIYSQWYKLLVQLVSKYIVARHVYYQSRRLMLAISGNLLTNHARFWSAETLLAWIKYQNAKADSRGQLPPPPFARTYRRQCVYHVISRTRKRSLNNRIRVCMVSNIAPPFSKSLICHLTGHKFAKISISMHAQLMCSSKALWGMHALEMFL